LTAFGKWVIDF